jgi:hypothetical protein
LARRRAHRGQRAGAGAAEPSGRPGDGEAVRARTSAKLLGKHDDDPLRAAAIAEPVPVLVALHPTRSSPPRACNPGDGGVDVIDGKGDTADT